MGRCPLIAEHGKTKCVFLRPQERAEEQHRENQDGIFHKLKVRRAAATGQQANRVCRPLARLRLPAGGVLQRPMQACRKSLNSDKRRLSYASLRSEEHTSELQS